MQFAIQRLANDLDTPYISSNSTVALVRLLRWTVRLRELAELARYEHLFEAIERAGQNSDDTQINRLLRRFIQDRGHPDWDEPDHGSAVPKKPHPPTRPAHNRQSLN